MYTRGFNEGQLVPLQPAEVQSLADEGQKLLSTARNLLLNTVTVGRTSKIFGRHDVPREFWAHPTALAATAMHSSHDPSPAAAEDSFSLIWWSQPGTQHEEDIQRSGGEAVASFIRSHPDDPYSPDNVAVHVDLQVREVSEESEVGILLGIFNKLRTTRPSDQSGVFNRLRPKRHYNRLDTADFIGDVITKKLFIGSPLAVRMPVSRAIEGTNLTRTGDIIFTPDVFKGRKAD